MVRALEAVRQSTDLFVIAYCVDDAALLAVQQIAEQYGAGKPVPETIASVFGAVDHWREMLSLPRTPHEGLVHAGITEKLRRRLGERSYLRAWREGQSVPIERVIDQASELLEATYQPGPGDRRLTDRDGVSTTLSQREREVLGCVAEGLSNQEIARRLFITERTVRFHVTSIFNKFGANNRAQAIAIASRLGLL